MTPTALRTYLEKLVGQNLRISAMLWGPPGIGKSSIVAQVAQAHDLELVDVRLSQLAPTDLRGLPVAEQGVSRWYPPEFLPGGGRGVLFLDELNLAPPAMQGVAQQLILERRVGSYVLPSEWFVWAAGNRKEDRASVFDMPVPLANRFLHLHAEPDFDSFKAYALEHRIHEQVVAFLSYRPGLLHKIDPQQPAWPSPRSWTMASALHGAGLDIAPAVGIGAAAEFAAFVTLYENLLDLDLILAGEGTDLPFPDEPSIRYATAIGLALRADDAEAGYHAFAWMARQAPAEWVNLFIADLRRQMEVQGKRGAFAVKIQQDPELRAYLERALALEAVG